jgi:hypothetical protein
VVAPETPATPRAEAGTTAEAARHPQAGPKLPAIEWKPIPPAQGAAPVTETPAAAAPASLDPMLAEWGKNPVEQDRAMSRKAYRDMKREQRISKRISKSLVPGGEFDANFAQLESGSPASGMGAERFVQIGETYHNENAVESQKDASAERQAQLRAQRDPVVQGRIDRANSRPAAPVQDSGTSGSKRKPSPPVGVSTSRIEAAVDRARKALKQQGVSGLHPSQYGDRLHTELRQTAESRLGKRLNPGTEFFNDRPMREIMGMSDAEAALPVADWLKHRGLEVPHLSTELRETPVGSLRPDLVYREPGNAYQMVDLTSQPNSPHLAKSLLYGLVLGNQ